MFRNSLFIVGVLVFFCTAGAARARDYISIVGSSTVYPFATVVAERFGKTTPYKTPKIESTGSGGGAASMRGTLPPSPGGSDRAIGGCRRRIR